jgi:hypothetical protein
MERRGLELALRRYTGQNVRVSFEDNGSTTTWSIDEPTPASDASAPGLSSEQASRAAEELEDAAQRDAAQEVHRGDVEQPAAATMTDTVADILRQADRPLSPKDVVAALESMGIPQENTVQVRGTLGYLNRKGQLRQLGRGAWILKGGPLDRAEDTLPVGVTGSVTGAETPAATLAEGVSENEELAQEEGEEQQYPVAAG